MRSERRPSPPSRPSTQEWRIRRDLAAAYRLAALFQWDDMIGTHFSARVPTAAGEPDQFLINPYGMLFEEITASSLIKVDVDGNILADTAYPVNRAGFIIHSAVHMARPEIGCVMHLHTDDGVAVSALEEGLLPLNQSAMVVRDRVAVHEYEGIAVEPREQARIVADLGDRDLMFLRNHGTLAAGRTVAETFASMYALEKACTFQVRTLSMNRPWRKPAAGILRKMERKPNDERRAQVLADYACNAVWPAMLRKLERICPDYKE
ncbi:aldolase [Novosphingobium malaysiense]|uniref:Aldolase n=2 Tax=Novosphingobium malaysiense TaxID=1348853 RepID=A0A0B1ZD60_9SPHN|nr:aldolase [Novosphingobium malaysiense]